MGDGHFIKKEEHSSDREEQERIFYFDTAGRTSALTGAHGTCGNCQERVQEKSIGFLFHTEDLKLKAIENLF